MRRGPDSILRGGGQSTVSCSNKRLLLLAPLCEQLLLQHLPFYVDEPSLILHKHFTDFKGRHCNCKSTFLSIKLTNFFPIMGNSAIDSLPGKTSEKRCSIFNGAFCTRCSRVKSQAFSCFKEEIIYGKKEEQNLRCFLLPLWLEPFTF